MYNAVFAYFSFLLIMILSLIYITLKYNIRHPLKFISFIVFLMILPVIIGYIYITYISPLPETVVPDVVGLNENDAVPRLEKMGLEVEVVSRGAGLSLITSQRPEPGKIVKIGRVVSIVLGKPGEENLIPTSVIINPLLTAESRPSSEIEIEVITQEGGSND